MPATAPAITLDFFKSSVLPMLQEKHKTADALKKAIAVFLKQGDVEEEIPVVNEDGEPVEITEIILVGAEPAEEPEDEPAADEVTAASLDAAVTRAVTRGLADLKKHGAKRGKGVRITGGDYRNDDKKSWGWKSSGEQLRAIKAAAIGHGMDDRLKTVPQGLKAGTGMSEFISSDGGFLLAPDTTDTIMEIVHDENSLLAATDGFTTTSNSIKVNAIHETSRADGSRRGGVRGYWLAEGGTATASKPTFRQLTMEPHKVVVLMYATDEQLDDTGPMLEQMITRTAGEEIAFKTGDAIINGNGAGMPLGILNAGCLVSVAKETGQTAATIVKANIDNMWSRCHARSRQNATWYINQDTEPQLEALAADVGTGGVPVYLPTGGITDSPNARLKGRPVQITEFSPTVGAVGDIILADLSQYLSITKGDVQSASSIHVQFTTDETAFRFTYRVDGQPWWSAALTPFKGTDTLSPFVALAIRS